MTDLAKVLASIPILQYDQVPMAIHRYWTALKASSERKLATEHVEVYVSDACEDKLVLLEMENSPTLVFMLPDIADKTIGMFSTSPSDPAHLRNILSREGLHLHGEDYLFYFADAEKQRLIADPDVRPLSESDHASFDAFQKSCSEADLDNAYVELDHWMVRGLFVDGRLVSIASAYPDGDEHIADIGVITHPLERGKGYATRLVRTICHDIREAKYEPQYRCQLDNAESILVAKSSGLSLFATWDVLSEEVELDTLVKKVNA